MAGFRLVFDPPGYKYASEPGIDWQIDGDELANRTGKAKNGESAPFIGPEGNFYNPPGTTWLLPRPKQFDASWNRSASLQDYVAPKAVWDWASGINPTTLIRDWNPLDIPGTAGTEGGDFMQFIVPATPGAVPLSVNIPAIEAAIFDVTLPAGIQVIAATKRTQLGLKLPMVQFQQYPEPQDTFLFGFGNIAVLLFGGVVYVLKDRSEAQDRSAWRLLGSKVLDEVDKGGLFRRLEGAVAGGSGGVTPIIATGRLRGMLLLPVGFDDLYLLGSAGSKVIKVRDTVGSGSTFRPYAVTTGRWWFAGVPNHKMAVQFQAIAYHHATHDLTEDAASPKAMMLDLGNGYAPGASATPNVFPVGQIFRDAGAPADLVHTVTTAGWDVESTKYNSRFYVQLRNPDNTAWVPDGAIRKGGLALELKPGDDVDAVGQTGAFGTTGCLPTMVKNILTNFPTVLADRAQPVGMPVYLNDDSFMALKVSVSLRDPLGKKYHVMLRKKGVQTLEAAGLTKRSDFPIHLEEDTDDGTFATTTIRAAGWVQSIEFTEHKFTLADGTESIRTYEFECGGLIHRMKDAPWRYFGSIVDPLNEGKLDHTDAVKRVLKQSGLDPTDANFVSVTDDSASPLEVRLLPGTPDQDPGTAGKRVDNPYEPEEDEDPAAWIERIERDWRGWLFYQLLGRQVRIGPDLREAGEWTSVATFYSSHANSAASGVGASLKQVYRAETKERFQPLLSNCISVGGKDLNGEPLPILIDEDWTSVSDPTAANFAGEPVRPVRIQPRMAINLKAQSIIARRYRNRLSRVERIREWDNYLAPWEVEPAPVDVGSVVTLQHRGKYLIVAIDLVLITRSIVHTQYTGEFLES